MRSLEELSEARLPPSLRGEVELRTTDAPALVLHSEARKRVPLPHAPKLSSSSGYSLREIRILDERGAHSSIRVPVERPLEVLVDGRLVGTLTTLGGGAELLVVGYLRNQLLISDVTALESVTVDWCSGTAVVITRNVTGATEQPHSVDAPQLRTPRISRGNLLAIIAGMRGCDAIFRAAGSVHGCALFQGADLWINVEDVSRRNAIDIITGWMALHGVLGGDKILFTTGRLSAEIVIKAAHNGIPILITRKGVTATACDLAVQRGMILFGRAYDHRYVCYTGADRFDSES